MKRDLDFRSHLKSGTFANQPFFILSSSLSYGYPLLSTPWDWGLTLLRATASSSNEGLVAMRIYPEQHNYHLAPCYLKIISNFSTDQDRNPKWGFEPEN